MNRRKRVGVLISGRGSNMAALIEAARAPDYPAEITLVISNRPDAPGLQTAARENIPALTIDHKGFASRRAFDASLDDALRDAGIDLVCNAGFMRLLSEEFVESWRDRQLNIHPSLLPAFRGLHTHERVIAAGVLISGCTVHFVRAQMDEGPIIAQAAVPVLPQDTADSLALRVLAAEHRIYPQALRLVAAGDVLVDGERVVASGHQARSSQDIQSGPCALFVPPLHG